MSQSTFDLSIFRSFILACSAPGPLYLIREIVVGEFGVQTDMVNLSLPFPHLIVPGQELLGELFRFASSDLFRLG